MYDRFGWQLRNTALWCYFCVAVASCAAQDLGLAAPDNGTLPPPTTLPAPVGLDVPSAIDSPSAVGTPALELPPPGGNDGALVPVPGELPVAREWYDPSTWISFDAVKLWEGSFEFGLNGTEGNAQSLSYRTGFDLKRTTDRFDWKVDLNYARSTSNGLDTQHNALSNSNLDWKLLETRWSAFTRAQLEYDQFRAFDLRLALNTGLSYKLVDTEITKWKTRFGAGASREFGGPVDEWTPEAVFGFDLSYQLTQRQKLETIVDYYPSLADFSDCRIVTDTSWQVMLDEASNLSLKIGIIDRYDSTPNGSKANDLDYAILLLWKT